MEEKRGKQEQPSLDTREFDFPKTTFSQNIENRVFQGIIVKTLSQIPGIALIDGTFFDNLIGRLDKIQGIDITQDAKTCSVQLTIQVKVQYGINIPKIAEIIQSKVAEAVTKTTGVRVSKVHVIFKELITQENELPEVMHPAISIPSEDEF